MRGPTRLLIVLNDEHARGLLVAVLRADGYPRRPLTPTSA